MTSDKSSEIFVSGASGWLGKELISLISENKLTNFTINDLRLFSSNGRSAGLWTRTWTRLVLFFV